MMLFTQPTRNGVSRAVGNAVVAGFATARDLNNVCRQDRIQNIFPPL
jgi:hypothetical protein